MTCSHLSSYLLKEIIQGQKYISRENFPYSVRLFFCWKFVRVFSCSCFFILYIRCITYYNIFYLNTIFTYFKRTFITEFLIICLSYFINGWSKFPVLFTITMSKFRLRDVILSVRQIITLINSYKLLLSAYLDNHQFTVTW
jgi:hypothetical protein